MISIKFYLLRNSIDRLSEGSLSPTMFLKHTGQQQRFTEYCCTGNKTQERVPLTERASPQGISVVHTEGCVHKENGLHTLDNMR